MPPARRYPIYAAALVPTWPDARTELETYRFELSRFGSTTRYGVATPRHAPFFFVGAGPERRKLLWRRDSFLEGSNIQPVTRYEVVSHKA